MKNIILSMKPFWFEKICSGKKVYEYRKRFLNEPVRAYIYVSAPIQAICAIIYLGFAQQIKITDKYTL